MRVRPTSLVSYVVTRIYHYVVLSAMDDPYPAHAHRSPILRALGLVD